MDSVFRSSSGIRRQVDRLSHPEFFLGPAPIKGGGVFAVLSEGSSCEISRVVAAQFGQEIVESACMLLFIEGCAPEDPTNMGIEGPVGDVEIKIHRFQLVFDGKFQPLPIILGTGSLRHHRPVSGELLVDLEELFVMFDFIPADFPYAFPLLLCRRQSGQRLVISDGLVFSVDCFRDIRDESV